MSHSHELFKLNVHCAPGIKRTMDRVDWRTHDVDHFVFHQPSEHMNSKVLSDLGADPNKALGTHHMYGNTASTTVALNMHEILKQREMARDDKLVFASAAAGFSLVTAAGVWV